MIIPRLSQDRGTTKIDWLDSRHSFSFGDYYDPNFVRFGPLRVINEDVVAPGQGFGMHGHRDMEIITYVLSGELAHKDSLGNGETIRPGEVQRMSAGTGIEHSEFNKSRSDPVHLLQIWIHPDKKSLAPSYEQKAYAPSDLLNKLRLVASQDGRDGSVTVHQDVELYASRMESGKHIAFDLKPERKAWLQVALGDVSVNGQQLAEGDGAAILDEKDIKIESSGGAEFLLFDMAK